MNDIKSFCQQIADVFDVDRIVLFGSHAWGNANVDSDVDLLIVMPHRGKTWQKADEIRKAVRPRFPLDLIVRSTQQITERLQMGDCFIRGIITEGETLYEASH